MAHTVFLTGATGNLGAPLLYRLATDPSVDTVFALVRAGSVKEALDRINRSVAVSVGQHDAELLKRKVQAVCGDITLSDLGVSTQAEVELRAQVTDIVHCAADTQFTLPLSEARRFNCQGTRHVAALARALRDAGSLHRFIHVSTAFVCGTAEGTIDESFAPTSTFSNSYEQSKYEAEQMLQREFGDLPCCIVRPSIVVGDSQTGRIRSCTALYMPLRWIVQGQLSGSMCQSNAALDVVSTDYVASSIAHLLLRASAGLPSPIHLTAGVRHCMTVREIAEFTCSYARLQKIPRCKSGKLGVERLARAFLPYMTLQREFSTARSEHSLSSAGISPRPVNEYLDLLLDHAFRTNWGSQALTAELPRDAAVCAA